MTVRAGGIFLLQENEPVRLLASMASIVTDARLGTVRIGFDAERQLEFPTRRQLELPTGLTFGALFLGVS